MTGRIDNVLFLCMSNSAHRLDNLALQKRLEEIGRDTPKAG